MVMSEHTVRQRTIYDTISIVRLCEQHVSEIMEGGRAELSRAYTFQPMVAHFSPQAHRKDLLCTRG